MPGRAQGQAVSLHLRWGEQQWEINGRSHPGGTYARFRLQSIITPWRRRLPLSEDCESYADDRPE
ncbi:hypothetical protein GCM10023317_53660 [Actinopolymorpha pittospori]